MSYVFYEEVQYSRDSGPLWPNSNGFIPIMSMDDGHIQNCINLIRSERVGRNWRKGYLTLFLRELERRKKRRTTLRMEDFL